MPHAILAAAQLAAAPLIFPAQAPRLPAAIDNRAAEAFTACRFWREPNARPAPSPEPVTLRAGHNASRDGPRLTVEGVTLSDEQGEQEIDAVAYRYAGWLVAADAHLVYERPYEGHLWLLIAPGATEPLQLPGVPVAAPQGHAFAAAAEDGAFRQSGVTIVEHRMEGMVIGAEIAEAAWPCDLHWLSENLLSLKVSIDGPGQAPTRWGLAEIRREAGRWVYHPPSAR